ncbi:unnamed protein product, partial [Meganyctiphanes norvegica]
EVADHITKGWEFTEDAEWPYISYLNVSESIPEDTGLYQCEYQNQPNIYDSTYVYVNGKKIIDEDKKVYFIDIHLSLNQAMDQSINLSMYMWVVMELVKKKPYRFQLPDRLSELKSNFLEFLKKIDSGINE